MNINIIVHIIIQVIINNILIFWNLLDGSCDLLHLIITCIFITMTSKVVNSIIKKWIHYFLTIISL